MDLQQLSDVERGALLGALLSDRVDQAATRRLAQLRSPQCQRAYTELQRCDHDQRLAVTRQLMTQALSPLPNRLDRVHPSWIEQRIGGEAAPVMALMLGALPSSLSKQIQLEPARGSDISPMLRWRLCQHLLATLRPMTLVDGDEVLDWSARRISDALVHLGCIAVAMIARRAGPAAVKQMTARLGEPYGERLRQAANRPPSWASDDHDFPLSSGKDVPPRDLLLRIGCQAFGAEVTTTTCQVIAQRLPADHLAARLLADSGGDGDRSAAMLIASDRWATKMGNEGQ